MIDGKTTETAPKRSKLKMGCGIAAALFVGIAIIGSLGGKSGNGSADQAQNKPAPQIYTIATARKIFDAYQANQLSAAKIYGNGPLEVSGTISAIDESLGYPVLRLATSNQFMPVTAEFEASATDALAKMQKGQKVTVQCESLSEAAGFINLTECAIK